MSQNNENKEKNEIQTTEMNDIKLENKEDKILIKVINDVGSIQLNSNNIVQSLHSIMESVENVDKSLKGSDKKDLALKTINWLVDHQSNLLDEEKKILKVIIEQVVPETINVIIKVSNGLSNLVNKTVSKCWCF
jgi:hypothetical protein